MTGSRFTVLYRKRLYRSHQGVIRKRSTASSNTKILSVALSKAKIDRNLHKDVLASLKSAFGADLKVSHIESFGSAGLTALAESIERENKLKLERQHQLGEESRTLKVLVPHHNTEFELEWREGQSILDVSQQDYSSLLREYIQGTCGGQMSCCSCHLYLTTQAYNFLEKSKKEPSVAEIDMLDLAYEPIDRGSRLGCQVKLDKSVLDWLGKDGALEVTIPPGVNDTWN